MEFFWESLNHTIQKILLRHGIFTFSNKFKHFWKNILFVDFDIDSLKTGNSHKVLTNKHFKIIFLFESFDFVSTWTNSHPEIGCLSEICVNDLNSFFYSSILALIFTSGIGKSVFTHFKEIISEEESSDRILNGFHHLKDILKNSIWALIVTLNVNTSNSDQKIKSWNNVWCVLNCLIKVDHSSTSSKVILEIVLEFWIKSNYTSHVVENCHKQDVIVSGWQQWCLEFC